MYLDLVRRQIDRKQSSSNHGCFTVYYPYNPGSILTNNGTKIYEGRLLQLLDALQLSRHVSQEDDFHFTNPQLPSCYLYIE